MKPIELRHIKPLIWRLILVPENLTLARLHPILLWAMGWQGGHLHEYEIAHLRYGMPPEEDWLGSEPLHDERRFRLSRFVESRLRRCKYIYDFGDHWEHTVAVEDVVARRERVPPVSCRLAKTPVRLKMWRPAWLLRVPDRNQGPVHEEPANMLRSVGGSFDPIALNLDDVNERLREIKA